MGNDRLENRSHTGGQARGLLRVRSAFSLADVFGVEGAGLFGAGGAFDDGAGVGKEGEFAAVEGGAEEEAVEGDGAGGDGFELAGDGGEVDGGRLAGRDAGSTFVLTGWKAGPTGIVTGWGAVTTVSLTGLKAGPTGRLAARDFGPPGVLVGGQGRPPHFFGHHCLIGFHSFGHPCLIGRHFIGNHSFVGRHGYVGNHCAARGVDLDGVAAAEGDGGGGGAAFEPGEFAAVAAGAGGAVAGGLDIHGHEAAGPEVEVEEAAENIGFFAAEELEGFGGLEAGDDVDDGADDAGGVAGGVHFGGRGFFEYAAEAWGFAGEDGHHEAGGADDGAVDPGAVGLDGQVVDEEAGFEVVGAVEEELGAVGEAFDVGVVDVEDVGLDGDARIDAAEFFGGGDGLGALGGDVVFVEEDLALEVVEFDKVAVADAEEAEAGADEGVGEDGAEGAAAEEDGAGVAEAVLAVGADAFEEDLAGVAGEGGVEVGERLVHGWMVLRALTARRQAARVDRSNPLWSPL